MGSCGGRGVLDENERAITKGEDMIGWGNVNTKELIQYFKLYSHSEILNANAFKQAAKCAKLNIEGFDKDDNPKGKFYGSISVGEEEDIRFAEQPLVLLAILLGKGSTKEKATRLFEEFDQDVSGKLGRLEIITMFTALIGAGIAKLPELGVGNTDEGFTTKEKIDAYQVKIGKNLDTGVEKLVNNVLGEETTDVEKDTFIENLCKPANAKVLSSHGFRSFILMSGTPELGENADETNQEEEEES